MISEVDLRDWDPVEMKKILTGIEFNYVYNGRESPFGRRDMDVLMAFLTKAEEVRKNLVPQVPAIFKSKEDKIWCRECENHVSYDDPCFVTHSGVKTVMRNGFSD